MILLCGIPSESPVRLVRQALEELGYPYVLFNQRLFAQLHMNFEIATGQLNGSLIIDHQHIPLQEIVGVYTRLMDDQSLPEVATLPTDAPARLRCRALHDTLSRWIELTPARVVNRSQPMGSNSSKAYQMQLIRNQGFLIPETLITNDPEIVHDFHRRHGHVIYKSISSVRSIVQLLKDEDYARLDKIRWCPTQFQEFVEGINVRVHVVDDQLFATQINSEATDYRYAQQQGSELALSAVELDNELAEKCLRLARSLNLPFAGIDLKVTPDNQVYCFEVNPSPGFSFYQENTGQPIAMAVAQYLTSGWQT